MNVQYYATFLVAIDGWLQKEEQAVTVGQAIMGGRWRNRVELTSAVPTTGFEFDGRPHIGTDREFGVVVIAVPPQKLANMPDEISRDWVAGDPVVANWRMQLVSFECGNHQSKNAYARAVFECDARVP